MKCHTGPCTQPCRQEMTLPCRCGSTSKSVVCWQLALGEEGEGPGGSASAVAEILCTRTCTALRYCGRHACKRVCCPLASLGKVAKGKGKKKTALDLTAVEMLDLDADGLHVCDLVCGKPLGCGLHKCDARDHAGPCAPCHRSSFDEVREEFMVVSCMRLDAEVGLQVICHCGLTILDPPVPCGTVLRCPHTCMRPPPPCGHPRHACYTLSEREVPANEFNVGVHTPATVIVVETTSCQKTKKKRILGLGVHLVLSWDRRSALVGRRNWETLLARGQERKCPVGLCVQSEFSP